jgi:hypothetical protein
MRKIFLFLLALPLFGTSQNQNVASSSRYFAKPDKVLEFEKGITAHIAKYHSGDWKWRIYEIQTGPDAGGYHVVEGPKTWDEFDKRGNLGEEHIKDWNKNVAPYLSEKYSSGYFVFREDLSTVQITNYTDKITITHVFPKTGMGNITEESLKKVKKGWDAGSQIVAVYQSVASGPTQYALVYRMKDGLKELQEGFRKPFKERYDSSNGEGTYEIFLEKIRESTDNSWSEMLFYRPDLSAK